MLEGEGGALKQRAGRSDVPVRVTWEQDWTREDAETSPRPDTARSAGRLCLSLGVCLPDTALDGRS